MTAETTLEGHHVMTTLTDFTKLSAIVAKTSTFIAKYNIREVLLTTMDTESWSRLQFFKFDTFSRSS